MTIQIHESPNGQIAEVVSEELLITDISSGTDLVGNLCFQGFDKVILHETAITPAFFDLRTRLAGEVLQKFSNYRIRLAIVGNFSAVKSNSLQDFIRESNKFGHVNFVETLEQARSVFV